MALAIEIPKINDEAFMRQEFDMIVAQRRPNQEQLSGNRTPTAGLPILLSLVLLAGCGSQNSDSSSALGDAPRSAIKVAKTMEDTPCNLLSPQNVADQLSVPVGKMKQTTLAPYCRYSWKDKTHRMDVSLAVSHVAEDAGGAARYFEQATRSMSGQEVADAMDKVSAEARKQGQDNPLTASVAGAAGGKGIQFEDIDGLGDKARFEPADGQMHVLIGNLYYKISAYHGPKSPTPTSIDPQSLRKASAQWMRETMPQRKEAAEKLARAVITNL